MYCILFRKLFIFLFIVSHVAVKAEDSTLRLKKLIRGGLSPKSVVHSGTGLFFAQNMMYSHTVRVYDRNYELVKVISDKVKPKDFGIDTIAGYLAGSPVEVAFSHKGKYAWVSNYNMSGEKFTNPGCDECVSDSFDVSYLYKINTESLTIEEMIQVGSVPKYVAVSPNDKYVLVSNWSGGDVSIVDIEKNKEIKRIRVGRFPRGIVVDSKSKYAYVTVMGSVHVLRIDLEDFSTSYIKNVGSGPRHLCITSDDSLLYVSLNTEGKIACVNLSDGTINKTSCPGSPRSMIITPDDRFMYVVNYSINKMSKIDLKTFKVTEQHETKEHPIGITYDEVNNEVWVACYSGVLMIYRETYYPGGPQWYDIFNVQDHLISVFDYVGKMGESFFASADTKKEISSFSKKENKELVKNENKKETEKSVTKKAATKTESKLVVAKNNPEAKKSKEIAKNTTVTVSNQNELASGNVFVIVGSFKVESNAAKLSSKLKQKGYTTTTIKNKNGTTYAAVGGFTNDESAKSTLEKIKSQEGIDAWIYRM